MRPRLPAHFEAVAARNHDVQEEEGGGLSLGIRNEIGGSGEAADGESGGFQLVLNQSGDIGVVFKNEYGLTQGPSLH